jgi:hypothetical protein
VSSFKKGRLLEDLVADLYLTPGFKVETRIKLPIVGSPKGLTREIDVLVSSTNTAFPARVAISCKNENSKIDISHVGDFRHALDQVGIPFGQGIFVSAKGFTSDAQESANTLGMRTFVYDGLSSSRLEEEVNRAFQSVLYVLASITSIHLFPYFEGLGLVPQKSFFFTIDREHPPSALDLLERLFQSWKAKQLPTEIGEHIAYFRPAQFEHKWAAILEFQCVGLVQEFDGSQTNKILIDTITGVAQKTKIEVKFDASTARGSLRQIKDEILILNPMPSVRLQIHSRVIVPRIVSNSRFYPITVSEREVLLKHSKSKKQETIDTPSIIYLADAWRVH